MLDTAVRHSTGHPITQTPRKLRDSCTDCASSKVRCSKEKPTCARCARRGVTCTYMVSRRTGRTSNAAITPASTGSTNAGPTATGTHSTSSRQKEAGKRNGRPSLRVRTPHLSFSSMRGGASAGTGGRNASGQYSPDPISAGPGTLTEADLWSSALTPSALVMDSPRLSPPLTTIGTDIGDFFDMDLHSPMMLDGLEQPSTAETHTDTGTSDLFGDVVSVSDLDGFSSYANGASAFDWAKSHSPPNNCFSVVMDILTRLFPNAPSGCTMPRNRGGTPRVAASGSRTMESVISENKQIIDSLTSLLDCDCTHDEYLISIMAMAALKVMGWYAAAASDDGTPSSPTSSSTSGSASASPATHDQRPPSSSSLGGGRGPLGEQVLRLPTTVGNYCVAGQHQGRMAAQLVLSELHRVQRLVNALSKRLESVRLRTGQAARSGTSSGSSSMGESGDFQGLGLGGGRAPPFSVPTFAQLEGDLRKRLKVLSTEIIDALRRA
ncbi:aflatoxin regulatory protein-domain-containing protein [Chaetomium strumarium]|uniref:Aflatoxin regulatory protein-domain-containing protein n=1 Tax=Chaetomium strumarium TaxID=1170767 RepID=A0AAJ0GMY6_9PEZI|nr:aflatoxin regulatory protein-domain-containing protein [Chaetomium strumarium]